MTIDAASGVVEWFVDLILAIYPIASQADFPPQPGQSWISRLPGMMQAPTGREKSVKNSESSA